MKNYELLYVLPASETSEEIVKNFQEVEKQIEKFGGKMLTTLLEHPFLTKAGMSRDEEPEELKAIPIVKRKLAYTIKHEKFGYYCLVNFEAEEKKIVDIDEYLRLSSVILRHMITQADPMSQEQLDLLQTLFARKKAEQDKEEAEQKESASLKEEPKKIFKKEPVAEEKPAEAAAEEAKVEAAEVKAEVKEEAKAEAAPVKEEAKAEIKEEIKEAVKEVKEKKAKETKKEEDAVKEDKKSTRKSKIKLEELEDKLDEILEDTII